jgi:hypothetical protein
MAAVPMAAVIRSAWTAVARAPAAATLIAVVAAVAAAYAAALAGVVDAGMVVASVEGCTES